MRLAVVVYESLVRNSEFFSTCACSTNILRFSRFLFSEPTDRAEIATTCVVRGSARPRSSASEIGASSRSKAELPPAAEKLLTKERRIPFPPAGRFQGVAAFAMWTLRSARSVGKWWLIFVLMPQWGGIVLFCNMSNVLISATTPDADSACPTLALADPRCRLWSGERPPRPLVGAKVFKTDDISVASPACVPVPCIST